MNKLWLVAGVLFLALAGVAVYRVWPLLNPDLTQIAPLDPGCDLRAGPCAGVLPGGGRITFGITPEAIPVLQPLRLDVRVQGLAAERVAVDFRGLEMNMGYNRPQLAAVAEGHFSGTGRIPVCVRDAMEWEARVLVESDRGLVAAPFRFITVKPGVELTPQ